MHQYLPSPPASTVHFAFLTVHFYALTILFGIVVALVVGSFRYKSLGGDPNEISAIAVWTIPAGIIGGRLYHVITSPDRYFGAKGKPLDALKIWQGGMGIWGAIALGTFAAYLTFKRVNRTQDFSVFADALAPGLLLAQAIGRWGNWFNNELFGKPTQLPWALKVPAEFRPLGFENFSTFQPTFLYESLWCLFGALFIIFALPKISVSCRLQRAPRPGSIFMGYVLYYCVGRLWIETLRIDPAHTIGGFRVNIWVSLVGICASSIQLLRMNRAAR
jgi:prolipoprotein diacylglyceryl transferase